MDLTREEEAALDGKYGEATSIAYNILWSVGQLTEAERLIDISSAHVSGVAYNTIGDAGLKFLSRISESGQFSVPTTVNPTGMDLNQWKKYGIDPAYAEKQQSIIRDFRYIELIFSIFYGFWFNEWEVNVERAIAK